MKVAVCDDELRVREEIKQWILEFEQCSCEVHCFADGEALCRDKQEFDLIFLDIDMEGMDGIETARWIRKRDKEVKIIYVTSYQEYVGGAFSVHAFAYLLKPVSQEKIFRQLQEVMAYQIPEPETEMVEFMTDSGRERLAVERIYYFEYLSRKICIHTDQGIFTCTGKISDVCRKMEAYGFALPHKSFVVNLYHVKAVKGYDIRMMNGDLIPLSQKKSSEFRRRLAGFLEERIRS